MTGNPMVCRQGSLDGIWRKEGGDDGNRDDDGIKEFVDDAIAEAQRRDDERKLSNLAEAEAALYRLFQAQAGQQATHHIAQRLE